MTSLYNNVEELNNAMCKYCNDTYYDNTIYPVTKCEGMRCEMIVEEYLAYLEDGGDPYDS